MRDSLTAVAAALALSATSLAAHAGDVKVGGKMFFDLSGKTVKDNTGATTDKTSGLNVSRFYLSADGKLDDVWSANMTYDFNKDNSDDRARPFVKKAYVQGKFDPMATVRVGSSDTAWIPYAEHAYGYRYVELEMIDRLGVGNSADWGVHVMGKNDLVNYQVGALNGGGYKNPSPTKSMDYEGRIGVTPVDGLTVAAAFYTGKLGQDTQATPAMNTATRYDGMVAYHSNGLRVGGEYFSGKNLSKTAVLSGPEDKSSGYSFWTSYDVTEQVAVFGRYDNAKLNKDTDPRFKDVYYNGGVQYKAAKNVNLALVYKNDQRKDSATAANNNKTSQVGLFGEVKF